MLAFLLAADRRVPQLFSLAFCHDFVPSCAQIGAFLKKVRDQLAPEFRELRHVSVDNLMYIKEDIILPQVCDHSH